MSTLQIGAALGVAIIGGIFYTVLGAGQDLASHAHAFVVALGCNIAMLALGGVLSLWLPGGPVRMARICSISRQNQNYAARSAELVIGRSGGNPSPYSVTCSTLPQM
jgi:hypothetical protein